MVIQGLRFGWFTEPPKPKKRRALHDLDTQSSSILGLPSHLPGHMPSHQSSTRRSDKPGHRFGKRVKKNTRNFSPLPRDAPATEAEKIGRPEQAVEKPTPAIETTRAEEVIVRDGCVPYIISRPIPEGKSLKKVVITVVSKDQGWSNYLGDYDTYRNSWTWFELSVGPPNDSADKWRGDVVRNLHAHGNFKEHTIEISDMELYEKAGGGDVLTVWALARFAGWVNMVKEVTIRYVVE